MPDQPDTSKYRSQARQLQEIYPSWSNDDLQSLLAEVNGDVELAATRIGDGRAEQWGAVTRKKEKKPTTPAPQAARTESRGARGGRGGRGGPGRGGASARGRGRPIPATNGHTPRETAPDSPAVVETPLAEPVPEPTAEPIYDTNIPQTDAWSTAANDSSHPSPVPQPAKATFKTPATSKMSWAQVARPQEKPTPPPPQPVSVPAPPAPQQQPLPVEPQVQEASLEWEAPTTVEAPVWEDEPPKSKLSSTETYELTPEEVVPEVPTHVEPPAVVAAEPEKLADPEPIQAPIPIPSAVAKAQAVGRPASVTHRNSARYKATGDSPVVMPATATPSFGNGIEKMGMQFGSLNLGGDSSEVDQTPASPEVPEAAPVTLHEPPVAAPAVPTSTSLSSGLFQTSAPPPQPAVVAQSHPLPTSVSQPTVTTQAPTTTVPPVQQYAPANNALHLPQQIQQQHQQSLQNQYAHGLPTHIEPQAPAQTPQQQAYFRSNAEPSPYFTPTSPAGQGQENPYGSFGGLSGAQGQNQQQAAFGDYGYADGQRNFYESYQPGAFGGRGGLAHDDIKGLPGTGSQPPNSAGIPPAGNSNPQSQQQQQAAQIPGQQGAAQGGPQALGYAPPPPHQPYYYNPYQQNQFYGAPYSAGYGVGGMGVGAIPQGFVKYPPMFQPPPGPGNNSTTAPGKQGGGPGVGAGIGASMGAGIGQAYGQGLYQHQQQGSYDDYTHHSHPQHQHQHQPHQHQQHQHQQHSHALGLADYSKQLYGNNSQQGFMGGLGGTGQSGASGVGAPSGITSSGQRGGGSPETSYKPYGGKDVGGVTSRGPGVQQQQQGQGGNQSQPQGQGQAGQGGPQGQGFYGGNRFGTGAAGVSPQGGPLYPQQGQNEASFYYPRQGQYWQ